MFCLSHYQGGTIQGIIPSYNAKIANEGICTSFDPCMPLWCGEGQLFYEPNTLCSSLHSLHPFFRSIHVYRVSQEEMSIFLEVILSVILCKKFYKNTCPIPNGFGDRAIWMHNRTIVDMKEILRVRTVSNSGIYCSSDRVGTVYNKCSKTPPSISMHFATRVKYSTYM